VQVKSSILLQHRLAEYTHVIRSSSDRLVCIQQTLQSFSKVLWWDLPTPRFFCQLR